MRHFTIEAIYNTSGNKLKHSGGRFTSNTPSEAARKAFSQALKHTRNNKSLEIHLRETTQGSLHKTYTYKVKRVSQPTEVEINGEIITYQYTTKVKAI